MKADGTKIAEDLKELHRRKDYNGYLVVQSLIERTSAAEERERVLREDVLREAAGAMCGYCRCGHEPRFAGLPGVTNKWTHAPVGEDVWPKSKTCTAPQIRALIAALATPAPEQPKENL